jgi:hypothetical protein
MFVLPIKYGDLTSRTMKLQQNTWHTGAIVQDG